MFCKTSVSYEFGGVTGAMGPAKLPLPAIGVAVEECSLGWKLCRLSEDIMIIADCLAESKPKDTWSRFLKHTHGILLRRLGKKRVVYLVKQSPENNAQESHWHSNVNLVTGVSMAWLDAAFSLEHAESSCAIGGIS